MSVTRARVPISGYNLLPNGGSGGSVRVVPEDDAPTVRVGDRVEATMWHRGQSVCIEGAVVGIDEWGLLIWQGAPLRATNDEFREFLAKLRAAPDRSRDG